MATTDFVIDDTMVGAALPIENGFLVNLRMTAPPPAYQVPFGNDGSGTWKSAYLQIRATGDHRDLFCACPDQGGVAGNVWITNRSLGFRGNLIIRAVPRGSVWQVTLSDVPVARSALATASWEAWSRSLREKIIPPQREPVLVRR